MKKLRDAITVRLPRELKNEVEGLCEENRMAASDFVREALKHYIAVSKFRKLRGEILPLAEKQGILTDEDVFDFTA